MARAERFVERAAGETQSRRGNAGAENVERAHRDFEALASRTNEVACRHAAGVKPQPRQWMWRGNFDPLGNLEARRSGFDRER